jgi:16S rRNA (adenine1518-N6/adenine1519-N6)-dimethyltransferase
MAQIYNSSSVNAPSQLDLERCAKRFHTKKHLGQNFLIDPQQLDRIAAALNLSGQDNVLEIGPGLGFLTHYLAASGANVTAVELDRSAVCQLNERKLSNLTVVHADFLSYDLTELTGRLSDGLKLKVAGNVPYQITSKILARLFGELDCPSPWFQALDQIVMTVQLEVARRFIATPGNGDYSQITLLTQYFSEPVLLEMVPAARFYPVPKVDSAVVMFTPRARPPIDCRNMRLLRQIVQAGFRQRRKMLKNNLAFLSLSPPALNSIFKTLNFDPQIRAEKLSIQQFALLTDAIDELTSRDSNSINA